VGAQLIDSLEDFCVTLPDGSVMTSEGRIALAHVLGVLRCGSDTIWLSAIKIARGCAMSMDCARGLISILPHREAYFDCGSYREAHEGLGDMRGFRVLKPGPVHSQARAMSQLVSLWQRGKSGVSPRS
jgi:hypothetical protein